MWLYLKYKYRDNYNITIILFHNWYSAFQVTNLLTFKPEKLSIFYISCEYYYSKLSYPVLLCQFFRLFKSSFIINSPLLINLENLNYAKNYLCDTLFYLKNNNNQTSFSEIIYIKNFNFYIIYYVICMYKNIILCTCINYV